MKENSWKLHGWKKLLTIDRFGFFFFFFFLNIHLWLQLSIWGSYEKNDFTKLQKLKEFFPCSGARLTNSIPTPISLLLLAAICSRHNNMNMGLTII